MPGILRMTAVLAAMLAAGLPVAGCGGEDDDTVEAPAEVAPTERPPQTGPIGPGDDRPQATDEPVGVAIRDFEFDPEEATVEQGVEVVWTNRGEVTHTVTKRSGAGEDFDSGEIPPGEEFRHVFEEPGEVRYICTIHPERMRAEVIVLP